jgi:long-chain-fatty-acid--[acyl-carrier-protein] ligase
MLRALRFVVWVLGRLVLSLRYRARIHGQSELRGLTRGALILPNHPAYTDPALVLTALWPQFHPRPMFFEGNFNNPAFRLLMKLLGALAVPDLNRPSAQARARAQQALEGAIEGLRRGDNIVIWPAGRIQRSSLEVLGPARAVADILEAVPDAEVILVRTRGLWGSRFSYARTGRTPRIGRALLASLGWLLASLLMLMPRRRVEITLERVDHSHLPELRRETLNPWLQAWYNADGPEKPTYVPYHFLLGPRTYEFPRPSGPTEVEPERIKPATRTAVVQILAHKLGRPLSTNEERPEIGLDQLGLDSLDRMEVTLEVEHQFGFSGDETPATLGQLWTLAEGLAARGPVKPPAPAWFQPPSDTGLLEFRGETLAEAFVTRALAHPKDTAVADDLAGVLTYGRLLIGARALSRRLAALPGDPVGLLLPASVACDAALLALLLAGKLPVVLNWTTGPAHLAHAARTMGLTHLVTSRQFVDRIGIEVEGVESVFLEELRAGIGRFELLRGWLAVHVWPGVIRRRVPRPPPDRPAVVLFTSGSERAPKAVPLTHRNLFNQMRAGTTVLGLTGRDSILGFLPAFHSFGLVVTGLWPLLGGLRMVHHPDPTDAGGLARKLAAYRPTLLLGPPTFISHILDRAAPGQLDSLRLIIIGAEKCPATLHERCAAAAPQAKLLEGYGLTECSPVVSVNSPDANRPGTCGKPFPGVEVCVVDLETGERLPPGRQGMLLVSGPTVFPGYIGYDGPSPFRELDGQRWYVTGDLAEVDADGYLHFGGRLKRFLKAGGEMISLLALEEPFGQRYPPTADGPRVAVEGTDADGARRIVLFTTEELTPRQANVILAEEGFRGIMRIDEVRRMKSIPVLGTGKTDYKALRAMIEEREAVAQ